MGKALYREYRPTTLDGVIGQKHITETLKHALSKGAISHAYLFTGPRGVGKTSVARILAHAINDIPYDESATHLDIIEIDAASNRRIDEIRDLREKVHIAPTSSKYKVYIIDEVHMLTREAFNALLKTLEEPPEHAVFILATTEAHKVPETIISRTQRYSFHPIVQDNAVEHLRSIAVQEKLNIDDGALALLAEHGGGSFRDSIGMLDQIAGFGHDMITREKVATLLGVPDSEVLITILKAMKDANSEVFFEQIQILKESGANPSKISQSIISLLRKNITVSDPILNASDSVRLMKELIGLTGTNSSYDILEITLLNALYDASNKEDVISKIPNNSPTSDIGTTPKIKESHDPNTTGAHETKIETVDVSKNNNIETTDLSEPLSVSSKPSDWDEVLEVFKQNHNTIYGVLRMAKVSIQDSQLTITFRFDFHKKQMTQLKNLTLLQKTIDSVLQKPHKIEILVEKSEKSEEKVQKPKKTENLSSISNIFGGAELLES